MSNRLLLAVWAFLWASAMVSGQTAKNGIRIELDQDGLYEIAWSDISSLLKTSSIDAERMRLMRGNIEIPMSFRSLNGGRFDRSSALVFYGEANRKHHSKLGVYRLEFKSGKKRIRLYRPQPTEETLEECMLSQKFEEDLVYNGMRTARTELLDLPRHDRVHWLWAQIPPATNTPGTPSQNFHSFLLRPSPRPRPVDNIPARLTIAMRAPLADGIEQEMVCELGGQVVGRHAWTSTNKVEVTFNVPTKLIKAATVLTIRNVSSTLAWDEPDNEISRERSNDIMVDSITLQHQSLLTGATTKQPQIIYDLDIPPSSGTLSLRFVNTSGSRSRFYDVKRRSWLEGTIVDCQPNQKRRIIAVNTEGYLKPRKLTRWSNRNLRLEQKGADWVCIALERFAAYMVPLQKLRQSQGLSTMIVTDREIYDSYNHGVFSPLAIKDFLSTANVVWKTKPKFVLLVGDADRDVNWISQRNVLPTLQTTTYYNGSTASDSAYLPPDAKGISIGRFPARREDEVHKMVRRTVDYETKSPAGPWTKRFNFIASEGRFGPMVDAMIESYAKRVLTDEIPASYDVTMTYANRTSSYLYPPAEFNDKVIDRLNEGALVYSYMGHGYAKGFDQLRIGNERFPILDIEDASQIDTGESPPLMTIIACSTAHFDNPNADCIGEELMRRSMGPLALIGSTRISHPYPNSLLSKELIKRLFDKRDLPIGQILNEAQQAIMANWAKDPITKLAKGLVGKLDIARLMQDHRDMYVLFGDPATKLRRPQQDLVLDCQDEAALGSVVSVSGSVANVGDQIITVTIEAKRDRIVFPITKFESKEQATPESIKKNYQAANHKVVAHGTAGLINGSFTVNIQLPMDVPAGAYVIKAFVTNDKAAHAGSRPLLLKGLPAKK
ncbi:MAG: hypothetical protein ACI97A_002803 [Planctomycetota bacterium]|jgi:hypothetical protein